MSATRVLSKMPPSAPPEHSFSPATGQPGDHSCRRQQDLAPLGPRCIPQRFARVEPIQTERACTVGRGLRQSHSSNSVSRLQTLSPAHKCAHAPTLLLPTLLLPTLLSTLYSPAHFPQEALYGAAGGQRVVVDVLGKLVQKLRARAVRVVGEVVERNFAQLRTRAEVRLVGAFAPAPVLVNQALQPLLPKLLGSAPQRAGRDRLVHVVDPRVHRGGALVEGLGNRRLGLGVGEALCVPAARVGSKEREAGGEAAKAAFFETPEATKRIGWHGSISRKSDVCVWPLAPEQVYDEPFARCPSPVTAASEGAC